MSHFILPLTIESRKILHLNLEADLGTDPKQVGEDIYIVELPTLSQKTILSLSKSRIIQSLEETVDDLEIKSLSLDFSYDTDLKCVRVVLSPNAERSTWQNQIATGLALQAVDSEVELQLRLVKSPVFKGLDYDHLFIQFVLRHPELGFEYSSSIKVYLADKKDILYTGFDFGSEASQMCEGVYNENENGIQKNDVNLFNEIKSKLRENAEDSRYMQFENSRLYKSIFYAKKEFNDNGYSPSNVNNGWVLPSDSIKTLNLIAETNSANFFNTWVQIPNLKLIYDNPSISGAITFDINTEQRKYTEDLIKIRKNLYASLLKEIICSYLQRRVHTKIYLKFTLLVPNIYSIGEINDTKKLIRAIISDQRNGFSQFIGGLEISNLSESDAAFLGCLSTYTVESGKYYIIIDCGKGTTDFSIIQFEGKDTYRSVYRNGFAGAGNLITFAFLRSVLHYIENSQSDYASKQAFQNFKNEHFVRGPQNWVKLGFFGLAEKWKQKYDNYLTQQEIEQEWNEARSGNLTFENMFSKTKDFGEMLTLWREINHVYDWGGYISTAIADITEKVHENLSQVVNHMKSECGGILLTGRGFLFQPLKNATKSILQTIKGLNKVKFIDTGEKDLKEICLDGVFVRNILTYNDMASTPIEVNKGTFRQFKRSDMKSRNLISDLLKMLNRIANDGEYYDEDTNTCKVLNRDFSECQFLMGGKRFQPTSIVKDVQEATLLHSRKGLFIKVKDSNSKTAIIEVEKVGKQDKTDRVMIEKSLFPGWYDPQLLDIN